MFLLSILITFITLLFLNLLSALLR